MPEHLETKFLTTPWTLILGSNDTGKASERPTRALIKLCENYRYPVYAFIRQRCGNADRARDLCQGFFAFLIEKKIYRNASPERGKFRTFLLTSVKNYLTNEHRDANAQKRGGAAEHLSIDAEEAEAQFGAELSEATPEALFDREWANAVFDRVWSMLQAEYDEINQADRFEALRSSLMEPEDSLPYVELASQLGLSEGGVKSAVFRLRGRFRELFRRTVAQLVENPNAVDEEIAYLMKVISHTQ